jgi:hypothetical protein
VFHQIFDSHFHANGSAAIEAHRFFGVSIKGISIITANTLRAVRAAAGTL